MNAPVDLQQDVFTILRDKYKKVSIQGGIILACLLIAIIFIIPQVQDIFTLRDQRSNLVEQISQLKANEVALQGISETTANQQLSVAEAALPAEKDFSAVLAAISNAANSSGVILSNYSFENPNGAVTSLPANLALQMVITIDGNVSETQRFVSQLKNELPLSDIYSVQISDEQSEVTVEFFYKPFPNLGFDPTAPVYSVSPQDIKTLSQLQSWENASVISSPILSSPSVAQTASGSGQ